VCNTDQANSEGRYLAAQGVEATIFNYAIWAWPHYSAIAAQFVPGPILMFSNVNPQYPGLVAMLAAAGSLDQVAAFTAASRATSTTTRCSSVLCSPPAARNRLR
jgi:L-fucose isomerase